MKVIVQGAGVVGRPTGMILERAGHEVAYHDPALGLDATGPADVCVVCCPCIDGMLPDVLCRANEYVVRSTVLPKAFDALPVGKRYHWPEFLTERTAEYDALHPDKLIWGSDTPVRGELMARRLLGAHFDSAPFVWMPIEASCITKLGINTIYTAKVLLANALYDALEGDEDIYRHVLEGLRLDKRINLTHTNIWQDGFRGAGGKCLPKDTGLLAKCLEGKTTGDLIRCMSEVNERLMREGAA
jgi:UDP-glucose 6-dehydrogenase